MSGRRTLPERRAVLKLGMWAFIGALVFSACWFVFVLLAVVVGG